MFKNIYIINDLPIICGIYTSERAILFEKKLTNLLKNIKNQIQYEVIGSERMERWIQLNCSKRTSRVLVIGDGPKKIVEKYWKNELDRYLFLPIKRFRNSDGKTIGYLNNGNGFKKNNLVNEGDDLRYWNIFEDVIFTGGTIRYILDELSKIDNKRKFEINCFFASRESIKEIIKIIPKRIEVYSEYLISGIPLKEWVVFLISDLMFGEINGVGYLDKEDWMRKSFGKRFGIVKKTILDERKEIEGKIK